ncbi:MAG: hypothetical protein E7515_01400 [Ruminococcaceae bacterium]|nr:hypothetical protein [Oscillospiraceae bacterium]
MKDYTIVLPLAIIIFGLTPVIIRDTYLNKNQKKYMFSILALISVLIVQNMADYQLQTVYMPYARTLVSILGYIIRPIIIVLFCYLVNPEVKNTAAWILVIVNAAVYSTATFSKYVFYIDDTNHYQGGIILNGKLSSTAYFICIALLIHLLYCTIKKYQSRKTWIWMVILNFFTIICSMIVEVTPLYQDYPVSYVTIAIVCCSLFFYIWLHLEFVKDHEQALMAEQRIKIMMSQIQPHFLFNTLSTIQALCRIDPKKAFHTTEKFGTYLRNNIDSLDQPELIPLEKEIEHTKIYAEIEMIRFPKINVEYKIEEKNFSIPALTIQPLVENAIRHGVRNREHGLVTVETKENEDNYEIIISDNGVGFDTETLKENDGSHIGLSNVKERIEKMCDGTFDIDSRINEGTKITITIPRNEE